MAEVTFINIIKFFYNRLLEKIARFYIHQIGTRFYRIPNAEVHGEEIGVLIEGIQGEQIEFKCYKQPIQYLFFRRGRIQRRKYNVFIISAQFSDQLPSRLKYFSNIRLFADSRSLIFRNDAVIFDVLLPIYLDFIEKIIISETD